MPLLFVFDMDDVIYDYDWRRRMDAVSAVTGLDLAELRRRWWNADGERRAEAGAWATGADYLAAANAALGTRIGADEWIAARRSAMTVRPEVVAAVERASRLGTVSLLTNNGALIHDRLEDLAPEIALLFGPLLRATSYYGARKPDPVVFERVLSAHGATAEDTFFADDLPENVAAARVVGLTAHLYTTPHDLAAATTAFASSRARLRRREPRPRDGGRPD